MHHKAKPLPKQHHSLTPVLSIRNADQALEFYKKALDAKELNRLDGPDGKLAHAELKIGDSILMLGEECPKMGCLSPTALGGTAVTLYLYVEDVDASFAKALSAGALQKQPVEDMFWGDRCGTLTDPFGHVWTLATHQKDLTPKQIAEAAEKAFTQTARA
ncbi:MAG: VOC family protein [Elusimicrobia bacterium]|nr:VOC family protein [Elusimicrobiota bacterium]